MARRRTNQTSQAKPNKSNNDSSKQTFLEHLYELRKRLFWVALTLVITTGIGLEINGRLVAVIMAPLKGGKLVYLTPGGGFSFIFTLSLYFGLLLTIPVITYQIYRFLQPMFRQTSRRFILSFITVSALLAAAGASLSYFLAIPGALGFLDGVAGSSIVPNLTADSYLNFVVTYTVGLAALFQLPLLLFLIDHIRPIPPGFLAKSQRYGIVATTILAGLITPSPDLINYSIVLFPMLGAYELGVFAVWTRRRLFRNRVAKAKVVETEPKTVAETEPITDEAPLTAIIEEMTEEEHEQPEIARVDPVSIEPTLLELIDEPASEQVELASEPLREAPAQPQPATPPASRQSVPVYQDVYRPTNPVAAPAQPALTPAPQSVRLTPSASRGRSVDGMRINEARYRTSIKVPPRIWSTQSQNDENSGDGLLTAQA